MQKWNRSIFLSSWLFRQVSFSLTFSLHIWTELVSHKRSVGWFWWLTRLSALSLVVAHFCLTSKQQVSLFQCFVLIVRTSAHSGSTFDKCMVLFLKDWWCLLSKPSTFYNQEKNADSSQIELILKLQAKRCMEVRCAKRAFYLLFLYAILCFSMKNKNAHLEKCMKLFGTQDDFGLTAKKSFWHHKSLCSLGKKKKIISNNSE